MKKRFSLIIACVMMVTFTAGLFTGCKSRENEEDKMLVSEWLYLINQSFGFSGYSHEEPYISTITEDDPSFEDVQTAFEYSVLPAGYTDLDLNDELTREFCALTLAGAIYIPNTDEITIADIDKLTYPESVTTVVNEGIMDLDSKGNFNPDDKMKYDEAVIAIETAYDSWSNHQFDHNLSYSLSEDVIDFAGLSTVDQTNEAGEYFVDTSYVEQQQNWLDENHFVYDSTSGNVTVDNIEEKGIEVGSIIALPESLEYPAGLFIKVTEIEEPSRTDTDTDTNANTGSYTLATQQAELDEIFPDGFVYQGIDTADFTQAVIYDADGNIVSAGRFADDDISLTPMSDGYVNVAYEQSHKIKIPIGDDELEIELKPGIGSLSASVELSSDKNSLGFGKDFTDFQVINSVSCNPCDYMKVGLQYKVTDKFTLKHEMAKEHWDFFSDKEATDTLQKIMEAVAEYTGEDLELSPTVARIALPVAPGVSVDLLVKLRFKMEGTIEIAITYEGQGIGIEKREWSFNPFDWHTPAPTAYYDKGTKTNTSIAGAIKMEGTIGLNVAACIAGINIVDIEPAIGLGLKMSAKLNYINESRQPVIEGSILNAYAIEAIAAADIITSPFSDLAQIENDREEALVDAESGEGRKFIACFDTTVYPIVKITAGTSDSVIGKYIGSISMEFCGPDSSPVFQSHAEMDSTGFHWQECTLEDVIDDGLERGDHIEIDPTTDAVVDIDDVLVYSINMLPETKRKIYTLSDLVIEAVDKTTGEKTGLVLVEQHFSNNGIKNGIADFFKNLFTKPVEDEEKVELEENQFSVKALSAGDAVIIVRTRDNLFKSELNVHVKEPEERANTAIVLKTYAASVALNDTIQLTMDSIPYGKDKTTVFWKTDDESIATIDANTGEIKGVSEGNCTVMAYIPGFEDSGVYCLITVTKDYTSANVSEYSSGYARSWIKIEGLPVIILEDA